MMVAKIRATMPNIYCWSVFKFLLSLFMQKISIKSNYHNSLCSIALSMLLLLGLQTSMPDGVCISQYYAMYTLLNIKIYQCILWHDTPFWIMAISNRNLNYTLITLISLNAVLLYWSVISNVMILYDEQMIRSKPCDWDIYLGHE